MGVVFSFLFFILILEFIIFFLHLFFFFLQIVSSFSLTVVKTIKVKICHVKISTSLFLLNINFVMVNFHNFNRTRHTHSIVALWEGTTTDTMNRFSLYRHNSFLQTWLRKEIHNLLLNFQIYAIDTYFVM